MVISGLPKYSDLTELQEIEVTMYEIFDEFKPESIHIVPRKGLGYVKFEDASSVEKAVEEFDGLEIGTGEESFTLHLCRKED